MGFEAFEAAFGWTGLLTDEERRLKWRVVRVPIRVDDTPWTYVVPPNHLLIEVGMLAPGVSGPSDTVIYFSVDDQDYYVLPHEGLRTHLGPYQHYTRGDDLEAVFNGVKLALGEGMFHGVLLVRGGQTIRVRRDTHSKGTAIDVELVWLRAVAPTASAGALKGRAA